MGGFYPVIGRRGALLAGAALLTVGQAGAVRAAGMPGERFLGMARRQ
jgi:hypothetical protein